MFSFKSQVYLTKDAVIKPVSGTLDHFIFHVVYTTLDEDGDRVNSTAIVIFVGSTGAFNHKVGLSDFIKGAHLEFICKQVRLAASIDGDIKFYVPAEQANIFVV